MLAVARGDLRAPVDANIMSFESFEAMAKFLNSENETFSSTEETSILHEGKSSKAPWQVDAISLKMSIDTFSGYPAGSLSDFN